MIEPSHTRQLSIGQLSSSDSFILYIESGAGRLDEIRRNALATQFLRQRPPSEPPARMTSRHPGMRKRRIINQAHLFESIEDGIC